MPLSHSNIVTSKWKVYIFTLLTYSKQWASETLFYDSFSGTDVARVTAAVLPKCSKYPVHFFFLDASLLAGQKRHFQRVKRNAWAYFWCIFLVWKIYARSVIGLWSWPKFHFDSEPFKVSIFNRSTSRLKIQIYIRFLYFWIEERMMYLWAKWQNGNDFHCCVRAC